MRSLFLFLYFIYQRLLLWLAHSIKKQSYKSYDYSMNLLITLGKNNIQAFINNATWHPNPWLKLLEFYITKKALLQERQVLKQKFTNLNKQLIFSKFILLNIRYRTKIKYCISSYIPGTYLEPKLQVAELTGRRKRNYLYETSKLCHFLSPSNTK